MSTRIVLMGLGSFGRGWLEQVLVPSEEIKIGGIVTRNREKLPYIIEETGLKEEQTYFDLGEALEQVKPDLFVNITPPDCHLSYCREAIIRGIPVFTEKPIAGSEADAGEMLRLAREYGVPVFVGENYRYFDITRKAKELIQKGAIGNLETIYFDFFRHHDIANYHTQMEHPLFMDVCIHHFDLLRYFTDQEPVRVRAVEWNPKKTVYRTNSCGMAFFEMSGGVSVSFRGALAYTDNETDWLGHWRIQGDEGVLFLRDGVLLLERDGKETRYELPVHEESLAAELEHVLDCLKTGQDSPNRIENNYRTDYMVRRTIQASEEGKEIRVAYPPHDLV